MCVYVSGADTTQTPNKTGRPRKRTAADTATPGRSGTKARTHAATDESPLTPAPARGADATPAAPGGVGARTRGAAAAGPSTASPTPDTHQAQRGKKRGAKQKAGGPNKKGPAAGSSAPVEPIVEIRDSKC